MQRDWVCEGDNVVSTGKSSPPFPSQGGRMKGTLLLILSLFCTEAVYTGAGILTPVRYVTLAHLRRVWCHL